MLKKSYWNLNPFYGFGMGATSLINNYRLARPNNISKYQKYVNQLKNGEECPKGNLETNFLKLELYLMGKLRTSEGIDVNLLSAEIRDIIVNMFKEKTHVKCRLFFLKRLKLSHLNRVLHFVIMYSFHSFFTPFHLGNCFIHVMRMLVLHDR